MARMWKWLLQNLDTFVLLAAGVVLFVLDVVGVLPKDASSPITGLLVLVAVYAIRQRSKTDQVAKLVRHLSSEVKRVKEGIGFERTSSAEENWEVAKHMVKHAGKGWIAYDTSSYINNEEFEDEVSSSIERGAMYWRLACFSQERNPKMTGWFQAHLSAKHDKSRRYDAFREAMKQGKALLLHYPLELDCDYLVTEENGHPRAAIMGFLCKRDVIQQLLYSAGVHVENEGSVNDLHNLYIHILWEAARQHLADQAKLPPNQRCICHSYYDKDADALRPK